MRTIRHNLPARRGVTAMLAMLYLVLFSTLAVGFYAAVGTSVQVVGNERRGGQALLATESGMQFMRYQLASMNISRDTPPDELFERVYEHLVDQLEGTGNLGPWSVGVKNQTIYVPIEPEGWIHLDDKGTRFRAIVERAGQQVLVTTIGGAAGVEVARGIEIKYGVAEKASAIFNYGVASKSAINMKGNTSIRGAVNPAHGSVLSASMSTSTPLVMEGSASISGDVSIVNPSAGISLSANSRIAGYNGGNQKIWDHVHFGVDEPQFPEIDTGVFVPYATNTYSGGSLLENVTIPPNTNPKFTGNVTIRGVLYIEAPNQVEFGGNAVVEGVIVVANDAPGDVGSNAITFKGTVSATPVEQLPPEFGSLRELTGAFILAPNFAVSFGGNFNTINGSIIASQLDFSGNAGGTIKGSVINLDDSSLNLAGNSDIIIESQGTADYPAGVYFGSNYVPLPSTYREVVVQ